MPQNELEAKLPAGFSIVDGALFFNCNACDKTHYIPDETGFALALLAKTESVEIQNKRIFIAPEQNGDKTILIGIGGEGFKLEIETAKILAIAILQQALEMEGK